MDQALQEGDATLLRLTAVYIIKALGLGSGLLGSSLMDHLLEHAAANLVEAVVLEPAEDLLFVGTQGCQHCLDRGLGFAFIFFLVLGIAFLFLLVLLRLCCDLSL